MTDREEANRAINKLQNLTNDQSFVLLVGGQDNLDCLLEAGDHEPTGVHVHLLATHYQALADALSTDVGSISKRGLDAHRQMDASGANKVTLIQEDN